MPTGALTSEIDVAQVVLYVFWFFFAALVIYLRREDKREGYPLENERTQRTTRVKAVGWPEVPKPKQFKMLDGSIVNKPDNKRDSRPVAAKPAARFLGAPLQPTGNPMTDGVGPAAYAEREDKPERLFERDEPKIAPLRSAPEFDIFEGDPDPRGKKVIGLDEAVAGTISDVWIDKPDCMIRYLEVDTGQKKVLLPFFLSQLGRRDGERVFVAKSVNADHFKEAPTTKNPDVVTKLEEDKIQAYFGSGHLYANRARTEPLV